MSGMGESALVCITGPNERRPSNSRSDHPVSPTDTRPVNGLRKENKDKRSLETDRTKAEPLTQESKETKTKPSKIWHPHFLNPDSHSKHHAHGVQTLSRFKRIDITQSKWIHHPDEDREIVTLNIKNEHEPESTRKSFRWIHHHRDISAVAFTEFQRHIADTEGLYTEEIAAATKCLKEVRLQRKISARGRYFDHTIHEAVAIDSKGDEQTPVKATFISIPIFALFHDQGSGSTPSRYPSSREIRTSDHHPVRSLLQCSNILAVDSERDQAQVIAKLGKETDSSERFIQVPELWALIINMYTMITCAPFSIQELCGDNISLRFETGPDGNTRAMSKDTRTIVKYTDLSGTLRDLECRQWHSLVDYIARIEGRKDELTSLLNDPRSEYKVVDLKFQPIDKARWIDIVDSQYERPEFVHLRLLKLVDRDILNLRLAQSKLQSYTAKSVILAASKVILRLLQQKLVQSRIKRATPQDIDRLKSRIDLVTKRTSELQRSRYFNRLMLFAARYHLINPQRTRKGNRMHPQKHKSPKDDQSHNHRGRTPSLHSPQPFLRLSPETSRASSPTESPVSQTSRSNDQSGRRSRTGSHSSGPKVPQIYVNDESFEPPTPPARQKRSQVRFSTAEDLHPFPPLHKVQSQPAKIPQVTLCLDTSGENSDIDLEAQSLGPTDYFQPQRLRRSSTSAYNTLFVHEVQDFVDIAENVPLLSRPATISRRHSVSSSSISVPVILDASPPRRPLDAEGDSATRVPMRRLRAPVSKWRNTISDSSRPPIEHTARPPVEEAKSTKVGESPVEWDLTQMAASRIDGAIGRLNPFFEWRSGRNPHRGPEKRLNGIRPQPPQSPTEKDKDNTILGNAVEILDSVDSLVCSGHYFAPLEFPVTPSDYADAPLSSPEKIIKKLEDERVTLYTFDPDEGPSLELGAELELFDVKVELFLNVYGLLRCFIHQDRHLVKVIAKIWGIVDNICQLSAKEERRITLTHRHEIQFVKLAMLQMRKFEEECCDLLKDVRPDSGEDETAVKYSLPQSLLPAFRNIVVYLLCIWKATTQWGIESEDVVLARDRTYDLLREADDAFIRMREHAEADDDQFAGEESIRTADTLLALLVENALDVSNRDDGSTDGPNFDLRHVYSKYTSKCITRAKREASARIHKDVRLLLEEIDTISAILDEQKEVFKDMFKKRESAMQKIDHRVQRRTLAHLEDTKHHFEKLLKHAQQARFWTSHSIEVRGEDNSKAIYVFTAVTVIFLPLSFVAGLLGMNTKEIRQTHDKQWLFWVVAVPFTICVLIVCLIIVRYRFAVRKRWNASAGWLLGCSRRSRRQRVRFV